MTRTMTQDRKSVRRASPAAGPVVSVSDETIDDLTTVFKQLADRNRLKILLALMENGPMHVTALKDLVRQTQPAVSHHLTLMRIIGLVGYIRDGKHNYYHIASDNIRDLLERFFSETPEPDTALTCPEFSLTYRRGEDA